MGLFRGGARVMEDREVWVGGVVQLILPICKKLPGGGGGVSG